MLRWLFLFVSMLVAPMLHAQDRVAFVVGNSSYENTAELANPANDARLVARSLEAVGFDVTMHLDLSRAGFGTAISDFLARTDGADVAIFYFAGHGMQLDGENFLLPTDASLRSEFDVMSESISLSTVSEAMRRRADSVLLFVDACRDNPLAQTFYAENFPQTRSAAARGLAPVTSGTAGSMVMFDASPGQVAYDGLGANSPFSLALARHLPTPNTEILTLTKRITADVRALTQDRQRPIVTNDIAREIYLLEAAVETGPPRAVPLPERAAEAWSDFRDSASPEALDAFAAEFEGTSYAALAADLSARLRREAEVARSGVPDGAPDWCNTPGNEAENLICRDPELLERDAELQALFESQLAVTGGATRGQALVQQREWRLSRDACGADRDCIAIAYELRRIALSEFGSETPPPLLIARAVQEELNRLSCGAGPPDGVIGPQTRDAYTLAESLSADLPQDADLEAVETLRALRAERAGLCSAIRRAAADPELMAGRWRVEQTGCPGEVGTEHSFILTLTHEGDGVYSGTLREGDWSRTVLGRATGGALSLVHVSNVGYRQSFYFEPMDEPFSMSGHTHNRCTLVATR
jgi:uncharacterized caspase-like protein